MENMSIPPPPVRSARSDPLGAPWPGLIPLRPLSMADIWGGAARLVLRRAAVLCPLALLGALAGMAADVALFAALPAEQQVISEDWMREVASGRMTIPLVTGVAAALCASDVLGPSTSTRTALARSKGYWLSLVATALAVALAVLGGLMALIVPGLLALAALSLAPAVVTVERTSPGAALRRCVELTRGSRLRILGTVLLALFLSSMVSTLLSALAPAGESLSGDLPRMLLAALASAVTTPWVAGVIALVYIDLRIRKENLAASLLRATMR
jgi:hypothetical protein